MANAGYVWETIICFRRYLSLSPLSSFECFLIVVIVFVRVVCARAHTFAFVDIYHFPTLKFWVLSHSSNCFSSSSMRTRMHARTRAPRTHMHTHARTHTRTHTSSRNWTYNCICIPNWNIISLHFFFMVLAFVTTNGYHLLIQSQ